MVENEEDQAAAAGVGRHCKVLRDFESDLIRIGTGTAVTLRRGSGDWAGDRSGTRRRSERAFRLGKGRKQVVEAFARELEPHVADIFSAAANDNFFFVVREARRLPLGDSDCHSLPPPSLTKPVDRNRPGLLRDPPTLPKRSGLCPDRIWTSPNIHPVGKKIRAA